MTTRDFIKKNYNLGGKVRWCSSVMADENGIIYSYGSHYPLAFQLAGLDIINEAGYSNTTSRHISWARQALDYKYVGVKLSREDVHVINRFYYTEEQKLSVVRSALEREFLSLMNEADGKKRKNTQTYRDLLAAAQDVREDLQRVKAVM